MLSIPRLHSRCCLPSSIVVSNTMLDSNHELLHLVTICIGLIIAFGLQQIVELLQRRRRARRQRDADALAQVAPTNDAPPPPGNNPPEL